MDPAAVKGLTHVLLLGLAQQITRVRHDPGTELIGIPPAESGLLKIGAEAIQANFDVLDGLLEWCATSRTTPTTRLFREAVYALDCTHDNKLSNASKVGAQKAYCTHEAQRGSGNT